MNRNDTISKVFKIPEVRGKKREEKLQPIDVLFNQETFFHKVTEIFAHL